MKQHIAAIYRTVKCRINCLRVRSYLNGQDLLSTCCSRCLSTFITAVCAFSCICCVSRIITFCGFCCICTLSCIIAVGITTAAGCQTENHSNCQHKGDYSFLHNFSSSLNFLFNKYRLFNVYIGLPHFIDLVNNNSFLNAICVTVQPC